MLSIGKEKLENGTKQRLLMDIRSLNIFIEAAELGSFTRTGEKLG